MRIRKNKIRRRQPDENKKKSFFANQGTEEKSPFFSGREAVQRKLIIGKSNDPQEKEAEAAAKQVVNQPVQKTQMKEEPVKKAEKEEEPVKKAEKEEEPVKKAEKEEEPVKKAEKEEEPVKKAEKEEEPVKKAEKEEEPVKKAEKEEEPVKKAGKDEEPVKKAEKEEEPVKKAEKEEEAVKKTEKEEEPAQAKSDTAIQTAAGGEKKETEKGPSTNTLESMLARQKGRGFELPNDLRVEMEKKFNAHFGQVRIHTDKAAEEMCEHLHALAFAHGKDIYFNAGKYNPHTSAGKELLAHELAHVVQNR